VARFKVMTTNFYEGTETNSYVSLDVRIMNGIGRFNAVVTRHVLSLHDRPIRCLP
jgi:hypothetical protein